MSLGFLLESTIWWVLIGSAAAGIYRFFCSGRMLAGAGLGVAASLAGKLLSDQGQAVAVVWPVMPAATSVCVVAWILFLHESARIRLNHQRASAKKTWIVLSIALAASLWAVRTGEPVIWLVGRIRHFEPLILTLFVGSAIAGATGGKARFVRVQQWALLTVLSIGLMVPLVWMVSTSFKDGHDSENLAGFMPRVAESVWDYDDARPLVRAKFRGRDVLAMVKSKPSPDRLLLSVERPFGLLGWEFEAPLSETTPAMREFQLYRWEAGGQAYRGTIVRELPAGRKEMAMWSQDGSQSGMAEVESSLLKPLWKPGARTRNYQDAIEWLPASSQSGWTFVKNSCILVLLNVLGTLLSCSFVAYGFARIRFGGQSLLFGLLIATMLLPGAVTMLPRFLVWRQLGAIDTLVPLWAGAFFASAFNVFVLRQFFLTLPGELEDAAKIDGCNPVQRYWKVSMPQIKPALAVIGIWTLFGSWNDYMGPLIYISSPEKMPVSYAVQLFASDRGGDQTLLMAVGTMATLPLLIAFLLGQRTLLTKVGLTRQSDK